MKRELEVLNTDETNLDYEDTCIVGCSCVGSCSLIRFTYYKESGIDISMYDQLGYYNYSWRDKLRHIWYIITKGHPWSDHTVLNKGHAKILKYWLNTLDLDSKEDTTERSVLRDTV